MGAKAKVMEGGYSGVDAALLRRFVPMSGLDDAHLAELTAYAGISEMHAGDSIPTDFKHADQTYYVLDGELELYAGAELVGTISGGTEQARFPLSHIRTEFRSARARTAVRLLRVDRARVSALLILEEPSAGAVTERRAGQAQVDSDKLVSRLLKSRLFSHIPAANVQRLLELTDPVPVHAGDVVIRQGETGNYCYIIEEGRCTVTRRGPSDAAPRTLGELGPGDSFGEEVLGTDRRRRTTVTMLRDGSLRRLSKQQFQELVGKPSVNFIGWRRAEELVRRGARWLDVRLPEEHRNDGLPSSLNVPLAELRSRARQLDRKVPHLVYCNTGQRSTAAALLLREQGISAYVLEDGLMGRRGGGAAHPGKDELKAQLMLADAEMRTAMRRKARADAARESTGNGADRDERRKHRARLDADSARANAAVGVAERRKLELETMLQAAEEKAASERRQADAIVEQMRRHTGERLQVEKKRLQSEYVQAAGAMDELRRARADAEAHFQRERERLEAQIAKAREAMLSEAERIRTDMAAAKRAAAEKAEHIRREQIEAERQLRAETEARLRTERRKLESELAASVASMETATQSLAMAEQARKDAQSEARRLAAELQAAEKRRQSRGDSVSEAGGGREDASRRLAAAQRSKRGRRDRSNVVEFKGLPRREDKPFNPSDTVVALRTELHAFEEKVAEASERIDDAERVRMQAQRAHLLVQEKLAKQRDLEEELGSRIYDEAQSWLEEERGRSEAEREEARRKAAERDRREAMKAEQKRRESAAESDLMSDVHAQLSGDFEDTGSVIEQSLRRRESVQHTPPPPDPDEERAMEERKKAKAALDRAREQIEKLRKQYDKE